VSQCAGGGGGGATTYANCRVDVLHASVFVVMAVYANTTDTDSCNMSPLWHTLCGEELLCIVVVVRWWWCGVGSNSVMRGPERHSHSIL